MTTSLSLILPIRNAQATLAAHVSQLLDVLGEMTPDFELIIVDDGSTDHTYEVAVEIFREYPQVKLVRHGELRGNQVAVESGLRAATGAVVLVHPPGGPIHSNDLLRAWRTRDSFAPQVPASAAYPRPINSGLLERLRQWGSKAAEANRAAQKPDVVPVLRRWENDAAHLAESRTVVKIGSERVKAEKAAWKKRAANLGKNVADDV